jgi:hypothetical protein
MGTRSLTHIKDEGETLVTIYRQMDGYPSGHGQDLANFLKGIRLINGIGMNDSGGTANGMGCLAAQLIAHFKDGVGNIYIDVPGRKADWEDYEYIISVRKGKIWLECWTVGYEETPAACLYAGSPSRFNAEKIEAADN